MASSEKNYHVFLSFRGTDVRKTFLRDLYAALNQKGVYTFVDNEELRKGEQISPALMRAIEESRLAIIIFSEDYASSRWCLEELAKIMECKAQKELIVLPVFYKVEPRELRCRIKTYGRAMTKHEEDPKKDQKTVETWKKALSDAGSLSGWVCNDGDEVEIIQSIVKELPIHLERTPLHVAEYLVGIDSRVEELISLSQKESDGDDVLMIGIWGPGGIGKTTIAKAIYNAIETQFQVAIFLDRVRETSNKCNGLVELQNILLSQTSPRHITVYSEGEGSSLIRKKLCHKKVLLVLDDVDDGHQLATLAGGGDWFGKGSRIFVTTRDQQLVISSQCKNRVYPVETLNDCEAQKLFVWHAFQKRKKSEIRKDLINRALNYASGLPLALEVLGSDLREKDESVWESKLRDLSNGPGEYIDRILKISFDGLDNNKKEIFLDIACFFKGKSIDYIKEVLDGCGFETTAGIDILIDRSLIRKEHGTLQMHDLVQLMGQNIVIQECPDDPGKRSRLWFCEDVQDILCEDTGTNAVKAIVLDMLKPEDKTMSLVEMTIKADVFKNMRMLRMLILPELHISSEGPVRLPNNLRWLEWPNAPSLEFGSKITNIDVPKSHIRDFEGKIKHFTKLKYINFSKCNSLDRFPDISSAPNLERLNLDGCKSLVEVHESVADHHKLKFLSLKFCSNLSIFPRTLKTKSLQALDLFGCSKLEKFSDILEKMEHLEELDLGCTAIKELPASVENLLFVKLINLAFCKRLATLPSSVYKLQNLEHLILRGCSNFVVFPKNLEDSTDPNGNLGFQNLFRLDLYGCNLSKIEFLESSSSFPKLAHLDLSGNKFTHLPTSINKYDDLEHLIMINCKQLQKIPQLPPNMHMLWAKGCRSLQEFPNLSGLSSKPLWVDLSLCHELFRKGANTNDVLSLKELSKMRDAEILLTGREMPEWFLHCKDSSISFMVPGDLYDKFLGLAICFVFSRKEDDVCFGIRVWFNGKLVRMSGTSFGAWKSDHVKIECLPRSELFQADKKMEVLLRDDQNHFQVELEYEGRLKNCGFRLIYEQQEDEPRIELQHHQPTETNWPLEERDSDEDNWIDTEEEDSSSETDDEFIKAIDPEEERRALFWADKINLPAVTDGCRAESGCRSRGHLLTKRFLREQGGDALPEVLSLLR